MLGTKNQIYLFHNLQEILKSVKMLIYLMVIGD